MRFPAESPCGRPEVTPCLLNRLATDEGSELDDSVACALCHLTVSHLESEIQNLGDQLRGYGGDEFDRGSRWASQIALESESVKASESASELTEEDVESARMTPRLGVYALREQLGQGRLGVVYRATHRLLEKDVAVKVLAEDLVSDPCVAFQLDQEIRMLGKLDHPNLVSVMDVGEAGGSRYLATELVAGVDLQTVVDQLGPINAPSACEIIRQVAIGLQYAHQKELIHCDIKPANLLVDLRPAGSVCVKVTDIGLSKVLHTAAKDLGRKQPDSAPANQFWAPEVVADSTSIDHRADIYSLGVTLRYLIRVGEGEERDDAMLDPESDPLRFAHPPTVAPALMDLIDRMTAHEPGDRPESMSQVVEAVAVFASHQELQSLLAEARANTNLRRPADLPLRLPPQPDPLLREAPSATSVAPPVKTRSADRSGRALLWLGSISAVVIVVSAWLLWTLGDGGYLTIRVDPPVSAQLELYREGKLIDQIDVTPEMGRLPTWYRSGTYELRLPAQYQNRIAIDSREFKIERNKTHTIVVTQANQVLQTEDIEH